MADLSVLYIESDPSQRSGFETEAANRGWNINTASFGEEHRIQKELADSTDLNMAAELLKTAHRGVSHTFQSQPC